MIRWYVSRAGKTRGPFTEPEIFELINKGQLEASDQTMIEGIDGWIPLERTAPFMISFGALPPLPRAPALEPWFEHPAVLAMSFFCCWPIGLTLLLRHPRAPLWVKICGVAFILLGGLLEVAILMRIFSR